MQFLVLFFSSRSRHTSYWRDWSSDVCSSDLAVEGVEHRPGDGRGGRRAEPGLLHDHRDGPLRLVGGGEPDEERRLLGGGLGAQDRKSVVKGKRVNLGGSRNT